MALSKQECHQLCSWIGKSPALDTFPPPLYQGSRDGITAQAFHAKCDNVAGGTLTIIWTNNGHVIGGYASVPWKSSGNYCADANAYLFRLKNSNAVSMEQFRQTGRSPQNAMHHSSYNGPLFGGGNDLFWSSNTNFGSSPGTYSIPSNLFNGTSSITEVMVYSVTALQAAQPPAPAKPTPQMAIDCTFTEDEHKKLLRQVLGFRPSKHHRDVEKLNLLLFGPAGAGKSSLLCTLDSIFQGEISQIVDTGTATDSLTRELRKIDLEADLDDLEGDDDTVPLRVWDCMGWSKDSFKTGELNYILDGNLPNRFKLSPNDMVITARTPGLVTAPTPADMVHAVIVVVPATEATEKAVIDRVGDVLRYTRPRDIRTVIAVTKVDAVDKQLAAQPELIYKSKPIATICEKVAAASGVPMRDVFPIKNYNAEVEPNFAVEMPVLKLLLHSQRAAKALLRSWKDTAAASAGAAAAAEPPGHGRLPPAYESTLPEPK